MLTVKVSRKVFVAFKNDGVKEIVGFSGRKTLMVVTAVDESPPVTSMKTEFTPIFIMSDAEGDPEATDAYVPELAFTFTVATPTSVTVGVTVIEVVVAVIVSE
jgi:hypothetical protein